MFGKEHPCAGGPRPAVFFVDCEAPDKTKVVPPWGPERANQDRRVGMLNECQGIFLDTSLEVCDCWQVNTCTLYTYRSYRLFTVFCERKMLIQSVQDTRMLHSLQDFIGQLNVSTNPDCMFSKQNLDDFQDEFRVLASFATRIFCSRSGWNTDSFWMSRMPRWWDPSREYQ